MLFYHNLNLYEVTSEAVLLNGFVQTATYISSQSLVRLELKYDVIDFCSVPSLNMHHTLKATDCDTTCCIDNYVRFALVSFYVLPLQQSMTVHTLDTICSEIQYTEAFLSIMLPTAERILVLLVFCLSLMQSEP
jgi:hypothetical protein